MKKGEKAVKKSDTKQAEAKGTKPSKKAFILSLPFRVPAADVVARGAVEGIDFTVEYVHTVRSKKRTSKARPLPKVSVPKMKSNGKFVVPENTMKFSIEGQGGGGGGGRMSKAEYLADLEAQEAKWKNTKRTGETFHDLVWALGLQALKRMMDTASKGPGVADA